MNTLMQEFEKQTQTLVKKGYAGMAHKTDEEFLALLEPLKARLAQLPSYSVDFEHGRLPFVIVVQYVPPETAMSLVDKNGKQGVTKMFPHRPEDFRTVAEEQIPDSTAYLLVDIDRGRESINIPPDEALGMIRKAGRHPLTIDEGVAIVIQYPEFLIKNNCFSLLASRHPGDKRVPAIWISGEKHPNLGWCWDGNPHTWLGSASCVRRVAL